MKYPFARPLAAALFTCIFAVPSLAQEVSGRILDASTGEGLPSTNIQVEGKLQGTISNEDGFFRLRLDDVPASLLIRYIGYESRRIPITSDGPFEITVRLEPVTYELEGLVVSGEDPGVRIMREVIARKKIWRESLRSYKADAYNRYTIANDTGIVMISETLAEVFWDRERGSREVVKARRRTANLKVEDALPDEPYIFNLYDDDIEFGGHRFIGITHPDALDVYDFRLEGTRVLDSLAVYDISVRPRRSTATAFVGRVAVLDSAFAMLEVELRPGESFIFPPPINRYEVRISQQFSNFGRDFWLPVDIREKAHLKISWGILFNMPAINVDQISRLTNYEVNVPLPDSLFDRKDYSVLDSAAVAVNRMEPYAVVPLTTREDVAFSGIDSTLSFRKAFRPRGLMASSIRFDEDDEKRRGLGIRWRPQLRRNRVEDFRIGTAAGRRIGKLWLEAQSVYLTGPDEWSYGGVARVREWPARPLSLEAGYHRTIDARSPLWTESQDRTDFTAVVTGSDQYDFFRNRRYYAQASVNLFESSDRFETNVALRFNREEHASFFVAGVASALAEPADRVNPSIEDGILTSLGLRLTVGEEVLLGVTGGNRLNVSVEHALGGDFAFTHLSGTLDLRAKTFARRRFIANTFDARIAAGATAGELPIQRTALITGSSRFVDPIYFGSFGGLRSLEHRVYQGDRYVGAYWEHSFRSLPFELIGWRWAARRGYGIIVHGAHARTWLSGRMQEEIGYVGAASDGFHHEIGVSLSGVFGLFRLDATRRLDASGFTLGIGVARIL